jgi:pyrroloquinoline quinone (PQQ) biosynthesis protein C
MKPCQELDAEVERALRRIDGHERPRAVIEGVASAQALAQFYASAHEAVRHARSFLSQSADSLESQGGGRELVELLRRKAREETGHDAWLEADLAQIGLPRGGRGTPGPTPAALSYVSFHRDVIALDGHAFLGTAYVLESLAVRRAGVAARSLAARAAIAGLDGARGAGLSFLQRHSEEDVGHVRELGRLVDHYVTQPRARDYVLLCARFTATVYPDFF